MPLPKDWNTAIRNSKDNSLMDIQAFDLLFFKGNDPVSRLIEWGGKTRFSHVALILDELHTLESDFKTPTSIRHFAYPKGSYVIKRVKQTLSDRQNEKIRQFVLDNIDMGYDLPYLFSRFFHRVIGTPIVRTPDRYTCDELSVDAFMAAGIILLEGVDITPGILAESPLLETIEGEF